MNGPLPDQQLVGDDADRVDVAARVDLGAEELLGRHVAGRAHDLAHLRQRRGIDARDAEIADLDAPVVVDQDVRGLDVAVHDALLVRVAQPVEELADHLPDLLQREVRLLLHVLEQRLAVHQLHHDVGDLVVLAVVVDRGDARMGQPADRLRLVAEARQRVLQVGRVERAPW